MNLIKRYFLYTLLAFACVLAACEQEDSDILNGRINTVYKAPKGPEGPGEIPPPKPPRIIKQEFPQATAWRIIWEDRSYEFEESWPTYFNTTNGSLYSANFLNATSWQNTANVDMSLVEGRITSPSSEDYNYLLKYVNRAKSTVFKRTGMSAGEFADFAQNDPGMFQSLFENEPYTATDYQPNRMDPGHEYAGWYEAGDLYTFKIESDPPKYGAIRIVEFPVPAEEPIIIEVVVQKAGVGGFLPKVQ